MKEFVVFISEIPSLLKEWDYHRNQGFDPNAVKSKSNQKFWWACSKGHSWCAVPFNRAHGAGCPYCTNRKAGYGNDLKTLYPKLCKEWDYKKNIFSPGEILPGTNKKVAWICSKGHKWAARVSARAIQGQGCRKCSRDERNRPGKGQSLADKFPGALTEWDYSRNEDSPYDLSPASSKSRWWTCKRCHNWKSTVSSRTRSSSLSVCPFCSNNRVCLDNCLATLRPDLSSEWADENPIKAFGVVCGSHKKVRWRCSVDSRHKWQAIVKDRVRGDGCPFCAGQKVLAEDSIQIKCPDLMEEWDYEKNKLKPCTIAPQSHSRIWWKCRVGHSWSATPCNRVKTSCPQCSGGPVSKVSQKWLDSLGLSELIREYRIDFESSYIKVDGFDPKTNTIYEFLGDFWHGNPEKFSPEDINPVSKKSFGELYDRTFRRFAKLEEAGYNIVFIWGKEFTNLNKSSCSY